MTCATLRLLAAPELHDRLQELWERTNHPALGRLLAGEPPVAGAAAAVEEDDWLATGLMTVYQQTGDAGVFALLFECMREHWLRAIKGRLRPGGVRVDADEVLQEAVLNMIRYPHRFQGDRAGALRRWSHGVIRNTLATMARAQTRQPLSLDDGEERQPEDRRAGTPARAAAEHEDAAIVDRAYVMFLALYLAHFERLPPLAKRLLEGVEIGHRCYRDLAAEAGLPVTNLKMVVFRGRRRIFRGLAESLAALERCEPALAPLCASGPVTRARSGFRSPSTRRPPAARAASRGS